MLPSKLPMDHLGWMHHQHALHRTLPMPGKQDAKEKPKGNPTASRETTGMGTE